MTTSQGYRAQCPLCARAYPASEMVHHLAQAHRVNLDRTQELGRRAARLLLQLPRHNPYHAKRVQNES